MSVPVHSRVQDVLDETLTEGMGLRLGITPVMRKQYPRKHGTIPFLTYYRLGGKA